MTLLKNTRVQQKFVEQFRTTRGRRGCGECMTCGRVLSIPPSTKPAGTAGDHVGTGGCTVPPARPAACQRFACLWLEGLFDRHERPDRTNVVFAVNADSIIATETKPGATEAPRMQKHIAMFVERGWPVIVRNVSGEAPIRPGSEGLTAKTKNGDGTNTPNVSRKGR